LHIISVVVLWLDTNFLFLFWWRRSRRRNVAILGGWDDAAERLFVEHKHGGASLETWVSTLAVPVAVARLA